MSEASAPKRVTRRTVAKGAAWTVPAIAIATPAHATATSGCVEFSFGPSSCKYPGNPFGYVLELCVSSTCPDENVYPLSVTRIDTNNGTYLTESEWSGPNTPGSPLVTAEFSEEECVVVDGFAHGSASTLTISYTMADGTTDAFEIPAPPTTGGCTVG